VVGRFLSLGGDQAFLFGYAGSRPVIDQCTAGNNMLFFMSDDGKISYPYAPYYSARLLTQNWLASSGLHELYPTVVRAPKQPALKTLTAYAVHRPDGLWSVLLINKDPDQTYDVKIGFGNGELVYFTPSELFQYSAGQYMLNNDASNPVPIKNDPPSSTI